MSIRLALRIDEHSYLDWTLDKSGGSGQKPGFLNPLHPKCA